MPSCDGMVLDPGRDRLNEKKRDGGADPTGVMPNRLEVNGAPPRPFPVTGATEGVMRESEGRARPRMPLNSCSRGSDWTLVAAAVRTIHASTKVGGGGLEAQYQELGCRWCTLQPELHPSRWGRSRYRQGTGLKSSIGLRHPRSTGRTDALLYLHKR